MCKQLGLCLSSDRQEKMLSYFVKEALDAAVASENVSSTAITILTKQSGNWWLTWVHLTLELAESNMLLLPFSIEDSGGFTPKTKNWGEALPKSDTRLYHTSKPDFTLFYPGAA